MRKYTFLFVMIIVFKLDALSQTSSNKMHSEITPTLFAQTDVNTSMNERDMAISPDGSEMFYTVYLQSSSFHTMIYRKRDKSGNWSFPKVASFSGKYSDMEPAFSADGLKLFFSSNRPHSSSKSNFDIWYVEKKNGEWGNSQNVGAPVNTAEDEYFPSVAANGNLYFTAAYKRGLGKEDIYIAQQYNGEYLEPHPLDSAVNSPLYEFNAFVTPDEKYILFTSYGRKDDKGRGDLYMCSKDEKGNWLPARNLSLINSERLDYSPFISFDRKTLFFTSERHSIPESFPAKPVTYDQLKKLFQQIQNGTGNIYMVSWDALLHALE